MMLRLCKIWATYIPCGSGMNSLVLFNIAHNVDKILEYTTVAARALQEVASCLAALGDPKYGMDSPLDTFRWVMVFLAFVRKLKDPMGTLHALRRLADLHAILGDEDTALSLFHAALLAATTMSIYRLRAECMVGIGDVMYGRGDSMQAKEMWAGAYLLFFRSSRMKDAAAVQKNLEQLLHPRGLFARPPAEPGTDPAERLAQILRLKHHTTEGFVIR
ncbi:hypothetical protein B0H19DRAFT_1262341 [Mycena capillaripes]|nr:hypothetical protein B0H19DRAFT_1262341 [Mycena capillaripes]